jgi:hypothetical protein
LNTVCVETEIQKEVVRHGLAEVRPVNLETDEHDAGPDQDANVHFADNIVFFTPCPAGERIESVQIFPVTIE